MALCLHRAWGGQGRRGRFACTVRGEGRGDEGASPAPCVGRAGGRVLRFHRAQLLGWLPHVAVV
eukprot:354653-Chlamydomonas_euryale.AAC.1